MTRLFTRLSMAFVALALTATTSYASPITYTVSRVIGPGSVTGTITTDGVLGVLGSSNVLGWTLTLNDGTSAFTLFGPTSGNNSQVLVQGSSFTATSSGLFFNYSGSGIVLFQNPFIGSSLNFWCLDNITAACTGAHASADIVTTSGSFASVFVTRSGTQQVATAVAPTPDAAPVPEPTTWVLMGIGLAGLAGRRLARRR